MYHLVIDLDYILHAILDDGSISVKMKNEQ